MVLPIGQFFTITIVTKLLLLLMLPTSTTTPLPTPCSADYSEEVDLMSDISYIVDLVDLPRGGLLIRG